MRTIAGRAHDFPGLTYVRPGYNDAGADSTVVSPTPVRQRYSFGKIDRALELPDLIEIQKRSYEWFLTDGLAETIQDISPIVDYTGNLAVEFGEFEFDAPTIDIDECRETEKTFSAPLSMTVRFVNRDTGEIREQRVFMGDFP
ncbi:MAG: DNA-directed polymerase subunit beta, partial [Thermoleophilia bacterium]|nr:DNA-directed polymerase subunit beta [Thermoleophilia bacterium]